MARFVLLFLSLTLFAEVGNSQTTSPNKGSEPERVKPVITVQDQPGTPLKISKVETQWATPDYQILEIYVGVENVSELEISSYGWRMDKGDGSQDKDGCFMYNLPAPGKTLKKGDSDGKSTWRKFPLDSPTPSITLSVDFVEFGDGSTWGADFCRTAENLSGLRAGALAAKDKFAQIRQEVDDKGLINLLKQDALKVEVPDGHSTVWVAAFREGVRRLFDKLREANQEGGLPEVERVVRLPFDASGK